MKTHILKLPKDYSFEKVGIKGKKFPVAEITQRAGVCLIETEKGHETTIIEHKCDFIYYILKGKGYFEINDKKENCIKDELVIVPAGSKFRYAGKLKMLLITTPPFYTEQEETLI
jgi:mannose-6-phosphate isomerase-like protein (cupin superfamily)